MPLFRRRRADETDDLVDDEAFDDDVDADGVDVDEDGVDVSDPRAPVRARTPVPTTGPWDSEDVSDDLHRLDLGALRIPVPEGCEIRVDVQPDHLVVAATLVHGHSTLQIHAFAAPRSEGLWDEVRTEIADSLRTSGGSADDATGPLGTELRARIPTEVPGQGTTMQAARFIGVDGPRWFLRGLMTGPAATDPTQARTLEQAFRDVVVVRGGEAMAPRDLLPLRLPKEAMDALPDAQAMDAAGEAPAEEQRPKPTLEMLERGPEITETR